MNFLIDTHTVIWFITNDEKLSLKASEIIESSGFQILPITSQHILKNATLEFHHQDPFDRIIIAQALTENLTILSKDNQFENYNVPVVW